jgi:hypothetical protein
MRFLITAGPTREPIDPVRYIGNRSSGKMGAALASAALAQGHTVTMIVGPVSVALPSGVERFDVETSQQMHDAVMSCFPRCNILIMAAAVADYRPKKVSETKLGRLDSLTLELEPTSDIVAAASQLKLPEQRTVGFSLEQRGDLARAQQKMQRKQLDLMVFNPTETMNADAIEATLLYPDGRVEAVPSSGKLAFAEVLVEFRERRQRQPRIALHPIHHPHGDRQAEDDQRNRRDQRRSARRGFGDRDLPNRNGTARPIVDQLHQLAAEPSEWLRFPAGLASELPQSLERGLADALEQVHQGDLVVADLRVEERADVGEPHLARAFDDHVALVDRAVDDAARVHRLDREDQFARHHARLAQRGFARNKFIQRRGVDVLPYQPCGPFIPIDAVQIRHATVGEFAHPGEAFPNRRMKLSLDDAVRVKQL